MNKNQPLCRGIIKYVDKKGHRFHMPGHKGNSFSSFMEEIYKYDLTEVDGLDDYHAPSGIIMDAQKCLANLLNVSHAYFLINGATAGVMAMIMGSLSSGDEIIIPRNCHRSIYHGIILSGATPVYIYPNTNNKYGIATHCSISHIEQTIKLHPRAKVMLLVNPSYHGFACDIGSIANLCRQYGIRLLVDQSHGGHLNFSHSLPASAIKMGAYGVVEGWHKTMGSLTQTGVLALSCYDQSIIDYLHILQSTSPSYLLMASLDAARDMWQQNSEVIIRDLIDKCNYIRDEIDKIKGISYIDRELKMLDEFFDYDITKLVIISTELGLSGYQMADILRYDYNIEVEMAEHIGVTLMITIGDTKNDILVLVKALQDISFRFYGNAQVITDFGDIPRAEMSVLPAVAFKGRKKSINIENSIGEVSADFIIPYPPGIPVIVPGEIISKQILDYTKDLIAAGGRIEGLSDNRRIKVVV